MTDSKESVVGSTGSETPQDNGSVVSDAATATESAALDAATATGSAVSDATTDTGSADESATAPQEESDKSKEAKVQTEYNQRLAAIMNLSCVPVGTAAEILKMRQRAGLWARRVLASGKDPKEIHRELTAILNAKDAVVCAILMQHVEVNSAPVSQADCTIEEDFRQMTEGLTADPVLLEKGMGYLRSVTV